MGIGISQTFAQNSEYEIILCSSSIESAKLGRKKIECKLKRWIEKGKIKVDDADIILSRIRVGNLDDCKECDFIIESIPENLEKKKEVFKKLQNICKKDCVFVTNTSSLSVTEIGAGILQPVIGMHFFNPAPVMKLIEITPGLNTQKTTMEKVIKFAESIGKTPIEVKESAGYIVNRMLIPMINEAIGLYADGIASVEGIDTAMKLGANHPMGPLQLGDFIGLDVCLAIMEVLQAETGDSKYRPHPMLKKMVRGGWLGKKSGRGFYIYEDIEIKENSNTRQLSGNYIKEI